MVSNLQIWSTVRCRLSIWSKDIFTKDNGLMLKILLINGLKPRYLISEWSQLTLNKRENKLNKNKYISITMAGELVGMSGSLRLLTD